MGKGPKQTFLQRRHTNGQQVYENVLNITNPQGHANQNHKTSSHTHQNVLCLCSVAQSHLTLCNPMDFSPPGSSVHRIFRARILEWVAISFSSDLPDPGIEPMSLASPTLAGSFFTTAPPGKPLLERLLSKSQNLFS